MKFEAKRAIWLAVIGIGIFFSITACQRNEPAETQAVARSQNILREVCDAYWDHMMGESVYLRLKYGKSIEKLPNVTFAYAKSLSDFAQSILEKIKEIDAEKLNHEEWISLELLKWQATNTVEGLKFYWLDFPVTPNSSPLRGVHRVFTTHSFESEGDLDHYVNLLKLYPLLVQGIRNKVKNQYEKDFVLPKDEFELMIPFLNAYIKEDDQSLFYVKDGRLEEIEAPVKEDFQHKILNIIKTGINPSLQNLVDYLKEEYREKAPDHVGIWQYPNGREYYRYLIKFYTTLDLTPEEIHETGLKHIQINEAEIEKIKESMGFKGSLAEFKHSLRTDQRFFPKTADEIGDKLRSFIAGMDQKIGQYFLRKPKAPYGTERLAPELEEAITFGYYQIPTATNPKGIYFYNGLKPEERSLLHAESLIYHELVPGHHFHHALQSENENLSAFRREAHFGAFSEGWAEYSAWLGREMGLYADPYDLCGLYLADTFLTTRLVVDTGMNYFEWPRSKAVQFMTDKTTFSPTQIYTESLRYSVGMPGQALSYKLGSIKFKELREKAEAALGDKFDVRKYHEAVLDSGSMPLNILEKHVDRFIEKELKSSGN